MDRPTKQEYYIGMAKSASLRSTCLRRSVGAVIVNNDSVVSTGYVGSPRGMPNCIDIKKCIRMKLGVKSGEHYELCRSVHAESNAIINAAREKGDVLGGTLYLYSKKNKETYIGGGEPSRHAYGPCGMCKKEIINAGIKKIIVMEEGEGGIREYSIEDIKNELLKGEEDLLK